MIKKILISFSSLFLLLNSTSAGILNVPANYSSIQSAILSAANTDTILVEPGTYFENINFRGKKIVLTSRFYLTQDTTYICSTVINGSQPLHPDTASCIILNSGEDSTTIIQGFTITGGAGTKWADEHGAGNYREGGGILTAYSSPTIRNNFIVNNWVINTVGVLTTGGGGLRCGDGTPRIYDNVIAFNKGRYGGGVVFNYCASAVLKNNLIMHNSGGQSYGGGGVWANGSGIVFLENNTIVNNHATGSGTYGGKGGGICALSTIVYLKNNIVWGNTQSAGNSIRNFGGTVTATYSDIDFTYPGVGNINSNPQFEDTLYFQLTQSSPCVDAGDTSASSADLNSGGAGALFPSLGTNRNDMGAYGGSKAKVLPLCNLLSLGLSIEKNRHEVLVYPNPTSNFFHIDSPGDKILGVEILNSMGTLIHSENFNQYSISINNKVYPPGIYFIRIQVAHQFIMKKIQFI